MYNIILDNEKFKYDISELMRLFVKPTEFSFITPDEPPATGAIVIEYPDGPADKNAVKRHYFNIMRGATGYSPPWGILTGVRPVKMVNEFFRSGLDEGQVFQKLKNEYFVREDKIKLLLDTSRNQRKISMIPGGETVSLYIGIPFCPSRCVYCSFTSNKADEAMIARYLEALYKELEFVAGQMKQSGIFAETIYVGGGTPTSISAVSLDGLLGFINKNFDKSRLLEFTVEAGRPDTITREKLKLIIEHGCSRISINPQSMHQKTLDRIGRNHSPEQIVDAFRMVRESSDLKINADVIAGLPGEDSSDFEDTLEQVVHLRPSNITVHTLALKRSSKLREIDEDYNYNHGAELEQMTGMAADFLLKAGYGPYYLYRQKQMSGNFENVGYTLPGDECIYNMRIMEEKQTNIALGAGGISKIYYPSENRLERIPNVSNHAVYIERIGEMIQRKKDMNFNHIK